MNKITSNVLIALILLLGFTAVVSAENRNPSTGGVMCTQEAKQCPDGSYVGRTGPRCEFAKCPGYDVNSPRPLQDTRVTPENRIQNRVASSTANRLEKRFEKMTKRYLSTIEREEKITSKLVSRIEKIKLNGGNTTEAERLVTEAKTHLRDARVAYEILKTSSIKADSATTTQRETMNEMRNSVKVIETHLKEAHKLLQKTVGVLRGVSQLRNATSTNEN
ncbi:MAG: hypothetical protein A2566_02985 [Candidatus Zambryskibacteria bacterium RIFOXYD1_FULL_40_13]|nr:MAG: hypothetical protein UT25_C0002G0087 [Parcubacteria group bacterium GW2011_GWC1_39_12]KKR19414.1 MAG: hypothetical protein UT49_C0002G0260 [Parcubacteria group bacterium GW2011_GWF1_39_37]KKR35204.1 MAG: hypothetical protein UT68_C0004G0012 [Parcubacteria group bacterium GW2011_GWC2_40_10]KKR52363.1 MAG: hypothetical protein UT89_C0002G0164 [Parcubacteria group bacterium GW2011_GWE1_40_20]KKR65627.1 MAG: hypothetical protein UU06_C0014G0005 [Parcubacteria group bacterium GW2011_GWB1_40_